MARKQRLGQGKSEPESDVKSKWWCSVIKRWKKGRKCSSSIGTANINTEVNHWGLWGAHGNFFFQAFIMRNKLVRTNNLLAGFRERNCCINCRGPRKMDSCLSLLAVVFGFFLKGKIFWPWIGNTWNNNHVKMGWQCFNIILLSLFLPIAESSQQRFRIGNNPLVYLRRNILRLK